MKQKKLGIRMAVPFFQIEDIIRQHQVQVFSSNYALYAEMSRRFMNILGNFVDPSEQEVYSIDECFLELTAYQRSPRFNRICTPNSRHSEKLVGSAMLHRHWLFQDSS